MRTFVAAVVVALVLAVAPPTNSAQSPPAPAAAACAAPTLAAEVPSTVGLSPRSLAIGDFNEDGFLDLATANTQSNSVSIVPGGPGGTLGAAAAIPVGFAPFDLAAADFNGDGHRDLAVIHISDFIVSILMGDGTGQFVSSSIDVEPPYFYYSVETGDFTGDGRDDIVLAGEVNSPSGFVGNVTLLAGDGAGGFAAPRHFQTPWPSNALATGDFNGDARPDVAALSTDGPQESRGALSILFANTSGGFGTPTIISVGRFPAAVAAGDVNADGRLDLVATNDVDRTVSVVLGDGTGGFALQAAIGVGGRPSGVTIADLNLDGFADIAVTNVVTVPGPPDPISMGVVQIIPADGTGGFGSLSTSFAGGQPRSPVAADFNADGRQDLAIADEQLYLMEGQVGLLLNTCGEQADVSVAMSGSDDLVAPFQDGALTLTADVTNHGPHTVPVVLKFVLHPSFSVEELTVSQGRCGPLENGVPRDNAPACWLGVLPAGNTARVTLRLRTEGEGAHLSTVRAFSGAFDPDVSDNYASVRTRVGFMGGGDFRLIYAPGDTHVALDWLSGYFQTGYYVARYVGGTRTILPEGPPLPPDATSFTDPAPVAGQVNCYVLGVLGDGGAVVGSSNAVCVKPGSASGTTPSSFGIQDDGTSSTRLHWNWIEPVPLTGYVLVAQPLDGGPQRRIQLGPSRRSYIDSGVDVATCYVLATYNGTTEIGRSDTYCFGPGTRDREW